MITKICKVDPENLSGNMEAIDEAAKVLRCGGLVAFPTETVYGLGANALDPFAAEKIYKAKGRPSDNPLLVHIKDIHDLYAITQNVPALALKLMDAFWPGPLTVVLPKKDCIPAQVSGGLPTVGVRFPLHPVARMLIKKSGAPIAAPSANTSGKPSPTRASHVAYDLNGKIDMLLDGGPVTYGVESTIVDFTLPAPRLLRPGSVTLEMLRKIIPQVEVDESVFALGTVDKPAAPGMKYTHYAPLATVTVVLGHPAKVAAYIQSQMENRSGKIGVMATDETRADYETMQYPPDLVLSVGSKENLETVVGGLYKCLRKFDFLGMDGVYAEGFDTTGLGLTVMNRLVKAAGGRVVNV